MQLAREKTERALLVHQIVTPLSVVPRAAAMVPVLLTSIGTSDARSSGSQTRSDPAFYRSTLLHTKRFTYGRVESDESGTQHTHRDGAEEGHWTPTSCRSLSTPRHHYFRPVCTRGSHVDATTSRHKLSVKSHSERCVKRWMTYDGMPDAARARGAKKAQKQAMKRMDTIHAHSRVSSERRAATRRALRLASRPLAFTQHEHR